MTPGAGRVLGVDPGSQRTGWGLVEPGPGGRGLALVACGALSPSARAPYPQRLAAIFSGLSQVIAQHQPLALAVEGVFSAKNVRTALLLGQARGVAILAGSLAGLPLFEYPPAEVKKALVGGGRAEKPQVRTMVEALLGVSLSDDQPQDVSDALAVAICHVHAQSFQDRLPATPGRKP